MTPRRAALCAGLGLSVFACGSHEATVDSPRGGPSPMLATSSHEIEYRLAPDTHVDEFVVLARPDSTFTVARQVYAALGIPVRAEDSRDGTLVGAPFVLPRRFLDQRPSYWFDCGTGAGGSRADQWAVRVEVATKLRAEPQGGTRVANQVTATARTREGTSTGPVVCTSKGAIEHQLALRIRDGIGF